MFGTNFSRLFKSRWAALFWAAGICWTAIDFVGFGSGGGKQANAAQSSADAATPQPSAQDVAAAKAFLGQ